MTLKRIFSITLAALFFWTAPMTVSAEEPATHHFDIDRPHGSVIVGQPATFTIKALQANDKINKSANHELTINVTSGGGSRAITTTTKSKMNRGVCELPLTITDAGQNIVQVSIGDPAGADYIFNSISVNALSQARGTEVRP